MGAKSHKAWTDAEEVFLIEHHGKLHNRELAKRLGREVYAIECRIARLRKVGLMRSAPKEPFWTEADDRELAACYQTLTADMLAERFGRSKGAIDTRIRRLRERGWKIDAVPSGRVRSRQAEQAMATLKVQEPSINAEREAMRDELAAYLKLQVTRFGMPQSQAAKLTQTLSEKVLKAPDDVFKRYSQQPVIAIVQGLHELPRRPR